jgi:hypothetical protein
LESFSGFSSSQNDVDGYSACDDYWLQCLYEWEKGDPEDVEKGFLKSTLLVKVRAPPNMLLCV